ncbi:hypothetical protein BDQ17DRAFT_1223026, partial [Cyathus striatus]
YKSFWCNNEPWLRAAGYILCLQYHAEWITLWLVVGATKLHILSEDYKPPMCIALMDAIHESDGSQVILKWNNITCDPMEVFVASFFSLAPLQYNKKKHCILIYECLDMSDNSDQMILVMLFLLFFDLPPFVCFGEIVDFIQQVLEGLQFMHRHNISHCDIEGTNIISDTLPLYKVAPHPL